MKKRTERRTPSTAKQGKKKRKASAPEKKQAKQRPPGKINKTDQPGKTAGKPAKVREITKPPKVEKKAPTLKDVRVDEVLLMRRKLAALGAEGGKTGRNPRLNAAQGAEEPLVPFAEPDETLRGLDLPRGKRGRDWAPAYLTALRACGMMIRSAEAAGVSRQTVWERREKDKAFADLEEKARKESAEMLEDEAYRRAIGGVRTLKFHEGMPVIDPRTGLPYEEVEYSDGLLTLLLKAHKPEKYRDKVDHEHTGGLHLTLDEFEQRLKEAQGGRPEGSAPPRVDAARPESEVAA